MVVLLVVQWVVPPFDLRFSTGTLNWHHPPLALTFTLQGDAEDSWWDQATYSATIAVEHHHPTPVAHWVSSCGHLPASCHMTHTVCSQPRGTRMIDGLPVTENCWQQQQTYHCGQPDDGSCAALVAKGCSSSTSTCAVKQDGHCVQFNETWSCPIRQCDGQGLACGGQFFCMAGHCSPEDKKPNHDFGQAVAGLAALAAAGKDFDKSHGVTAFTGSVMHCSVWTTDAKNCCSINGWLIGCHEDEKKLAKARQKKLTVHVGDYKATCALGKCVERVETYCVFGSKLARLIQQVGRSEQLGISFGSAKQANCRGISPQELQQIDFNRIDFSDVTADLNNNQHVPAAQTLTGQNVAKVNDKVKRGLPL